MNSGWIQIDAEFLRHAAASLTDDDAKAYFNGRSPDWAEIAQNVPASRLVLAELTSHLMCESPSARVGRMMVIKGPSGEGKSTVLMQLAAELASRSSARVLWRTVGTSVNMEELRNLPADKVFMFSDDGDEIVKPLYEFLRTSHSPSIHFILATRTTDWAYVSGSTYPWRSVSGYREAEISGLEREDALRIVTAWDHYGSDGLGALVGVPATKRVDSLMSAVHEAATVSEGALLGGMLEVRFGDLLTDRIRNLMRQLVRTRFSGGSSLTNALLYISAAHAANLRLTETILAEALAVDVSSVRSDVIAPLRDEAVVSASQSGIRARHQMIAQAVVDVATDFGASLADTFSALTRAAMRVGRHEFIVGYEDFAYLCRRFETSNSDIAIATARAAVKEEPDMLTYVQNLAHVLRISGQIDEAGGLCDRTSVRLSRMTAKPYHRRAFFFEWSAIEGSRLHRFVGVWLAAVSLSDYSDFGPPSLQHIELALASIGGTLLTISEQTPDNVYRMGVRAAETISRKMSLSATASQFFARQRESMDRVNMSEIPIDSCVEALRVAVAEAWRHRDRELQGVAPGSSLKFKMMAQVLDIAE